MDSNVLCAVRRHIEALEEKVGCQISEIRRQTDRPREAALARLEEKMNTTEGLHLKFDLRLSELTGNVRGLSEEMQAQIRRVDLMDDRLSEWRHQMEEEIRQKYADFELSIQKVSSSLRVGASCVEDAQKRQQQRLQKLEADLAGLSQEEKRSQENLASVHARLDGLEDRHLEVVTAAEAHRSVVREGPVGETADAALLALLEQRVSDVTEKVAQVVQDSFDLHASVSAQEEQLRSLRTLSDSREEHWRTLSEQVERGEWASKLEQLRQGVQEEAKQRLQQLEDVKLLSRRVDYQEQGQEELRNVCEQLASDASLTMAVEECRARIEDSEARLGALDSDLQVARAASQLAPRVSALVSQLQDLVPRVTEQEVAIRELRAATCAGHGCSRPVAAAHP